jgi:drug/metabolite transporter (DMT)-like permease
LIALACVSWGIDNHLTALIDGITPAQSTFWKGIAAGTVNLTIGLFSSQFSGNALQIGGALMLGALSYGISILLYITSAQNLGATRAQLIFSSAPFFGLLLSLTLGEPLSLYQGIAFLLFSISTFFLFKESHAHHHTHTPVEHVHMHYHPDMHHDHIHPEQPSGSYRHSHPHKHQQVEHSHPHWPDLHHRHEHD